MSSPLWQARFFTSVNHLSHLPLLTVPEIAFAGRSNAGKSSAINILCHQKHLAFTSKTPGRTQHINYFSIGGSYVHWHRKDPTQTEKICAFLVDLPGYGYAEVTPHVKAHWEKLLSAYVVTRKQLKALVLIMDARRPFTDLDKQLFGWFAETNKPVHCLLTKVDKLNRTEAQKAYDVTMQVLDTYRETYQTSAVYSVQLFSSLKRIGLEEADDAINRLLFPS